MYILTHILVNSLLIIKERIKKKKKPLKILLYYLNAYSPPYLFFRSLQITEITYSILNPYSSVDCVRIVQCFA